MKRTMHRSCITRTRRTSGRGIRQVPHLIAEGCGHGWTGKACRAAVAQMCGFCTANEALLIALEGVSKRGLTRV